MTSRLLNTTALFSLAMVVLGIWMLVVAQWALAATERTICYIWWSTTGIGSLAIVLGAFGAVWGFRRGPR